MSAPQAQPVGVGGWIMTALFAMFAIAMLGKCANLVFGTTLLMDDCQKAYHREYMYKGTSQDIGEDAYYLNCRDAMDGIDALLNS